MKYALVTGGSSGIGLEYVRQLAEMGHNVLIVSNRTEENERVAEEIRRRYSVTAGAIYADLSKEDCAQELYAWCKDHHAEVEILVSNAGILHFGKLVHTDPSAIDRIMAIHCTTPAKLCRLFGAEMAERHSGHILLMSSITAWTPLPTMSLYGATKTFLKNFSQSLWYELRDEGVSVTTVFPSAVDTPFYELDDKIRKRLRKVGLMISAEELAHKALHAMFHRRRTCTPTFWAKLQVFLCKLMPAHAYIPLLKIPALRKILIRL